MAKQRQSSCGRASASASAAGLRRLQGERQGVGVCTAEGRACRWQEVGRRGNRASVFAGRKAGRRRLQAELRASDIISAYLYFRTQGGRRKAERRASVGRKAKRKTDRRRNAIWKTNRRRKAKRQAEDGSSGRSRSPCRRQGGRAASQDVAGRLRRAVSQDVAAGRRRRVRRCKAGRRKADLLSRIALIPCEEKNPRERER